MDSLYFGLGPATACAVGLNKNVMYKNRVHFLAAVYNLQPEEIKSC
jgi:hypothetical protein